MKNVIVLVCLFFLPFFTCAQYKTGDDAMLREVAVSFDDLPTVAINKSNSVKTEITVKLLAMIKKQEIPAIGMVNEVKLYNDGKIDTFSVSLLQQWVDAGLELGNHTYSHIDFNKTTLEQQEEELLKGELIIKELLKQKGMTPRYFRYPFLHTGTDTTARQQFELFLKEHGYTMATVSIDNSEWIFASAYMKALEKKDTSLADRIAKEYAPYMEEKFAFYEQCCIELFGRNIKHILLVHANRLNADHFTEVAEMLKKRGYKFISITEALTDAAYKINPIYKSKADMPWPHLWPLVQNLKGESFKRTPFTPDYIMKAAEVTKE